MTLITFETHFSFMIAVCKREKDEEENGKREGGLRKNS